MHSAVSQWSKEIVDKKLSKQHGHHKLTTRTHTVCKPLDTSGSYCSIVAPTFEPVYGSLDTVRGTRLFRTTKEKSNKSEPS